MWRKAKNFLQVNIIENSIMSYKEAIEGLLTEIGGVEHIISVLWAIDEPNNIHNK